MMEIWFQLPLGILKRKKLRFWEKWIWDYWKWVNGWK